MPSRSSHDSHRAALVVTCIFLFPQMLSAAITLPLNGYCKPGRYFPISVDGNDAAHPITFQAAGCLPSFFAGSLRSRIIVPMLAIGSPKELTWQTNPTSPRPLLLFSPKEDERLIGVTTNDISEASQIFPKARLIPVQLDLADPLPGPPAAWESLDAIVLDTKMFDRVSDAQRSALLAAGVILATNGATAPDTRWPWQRQGSLWLLCCTPIGPKPVVDQDAYTPTFSWKPGYSTAFRWQVAGAGALFTLITTALLLRPHRFTQITTISFILIASILIAAWKKSLGTIDRIGGDIVVDHGNLIQRDEWVYEQAKNGSFSAVPWSGSTHPIFSSAQNQPAMQLNIAASGDLTFVYHAMPQHTMAFMRREIKSVPLPPANIANESPMRDLAKAEYLSPDNRIIGQTTAPPGRWPSVVISNGK